MKAGPLWQVAVTSSREAEEAVAALLERLFGQPAALYVGEGESTSIATVYSSQSRQRVTAKREALDAGLKFLAACGLDTTPVKVSIRRVRREDWSQSWKKYFKVIEIGSALLIKPSWSKREPRPGQAVVTLDPGLSFGTGQHPTTAFCLRQLVKARKTGQRQSFLDIGTGSGILAISAVKLGYHPVRGFDLDPTAVRVALANARKNRVEQKLVVVRENLAESSMEVRVRYDVICANLTDDLLIAQSRRILNRLRPTGSLVLAGVLASQFPCVRAAFEELGLRLAGSRSEGGWESGSFVSQER
jgi:ribosomal protein L11 methyltransferase